jgi:hypothetical protein
MNRRRFLQAAGSAALSFLPPKMTDADIKALPPTLTAGSLEQIPLHVRLIPLGVTTFRLRDIHLGDDGDAWIGANEPDRHILVVNLKTGVCRKVDMNLGDGQYLDMVLPIGEKIVVCGGGYARQVIITRKTGQKIEKPLATPEPLIYGGVIAGPCAYLFDCAHGIYRWDTRDDSSAFYPYTLPGRPLVGGRYVESQHAIYGVPWWQEGQPPTPLVKFDLKTHKYVAAFQPPWENVRTMPPVQVGDTLYTTDMFGGTLMLFDLRTERWVRRYRLPDYDKTWKYTTACAVLGPYLICNLSTFQGVKNANGTYGFDGQRHHFVNQILVFDMRHERAGFVPVPTLSSTGYATIAYLETLQGKLYGTCVDSTVMPDGKPNEKGPAFLAEFTIAKPHDSTTG